MKILLHCSATYRGEEGGEGEKEFASEEEKEKWEEGKVLLNPEPRTLSPHPRTTSISASPYPIPSHTPQNPSNRRCGGSSGGSGTRSAKR